MRKIITILLICISLSFTITSKAQIPSQAQINSINIDNLSDEAIANYWNKAKAEGYTLDQLEIIAKSRGMSATQFSKLRRRISQLKFTDQNISNANNDIVNPAISVLDKFGLDGTTSIEPLKNRLFGFDFFNNPNISFSPNLNLATPTTYQLGPGDDILIDIWGAAENNYRLQVDREGAIRIKNIGPIYVSGLSIEKAKSKIISYLKKIYSGIGSPTNNVNKVYAEVSLVGIRTVQVNIIGEIKVPGTYALSALSTVLNALYASGGPTENGTFRSIKLIRKGKLYKIFDIYKYLIEGSEDGNVLLRDQDVIIVPPYTSKIEVTGSVKRPGLYELKKGETLKNLIQYFSGFTANAYKERLLIKRVNGTQKEVSEVLLKDQESFILNDGDVLDVGLVIDRFKNRVSIGGAVYRPGNYELTPKLTLSGLLEKASGLKDDAFLDRGIIYRTIDDVKQEILPFSVQKIIEKTVNISLKREDSIHIFSKYSLKEKYTVSINGAVNFPQTIDFVEKMHVEDLIAISGGFKDGANPKVVDISRRVKGGDFETISINIKHASTNNLLIGSNSDLYLKPFDRVSVRFLKGYTPQKNVTIKGEVTYPGSYSITNRDERISDLVAKAGGLSPYAYTKGATLVRKNLNATDKQQLEFLKSITAKDSLLGDKNLNQKSVFKIGIDLEKIMSANGKRSDIDLILKEGDALIIPSEKQTVEVRGEVLLPSLIQFKKSLSLKDYIANSGGFSEKAKKRKAYVIYANGDVKSTKSFFFFKTYPKVEPGAIILVPQKSKSNNKLSITEIIGITTSLSTLGLLVRSF